LAADVPECLPVVQGNRINAREGRVKNFPEALSLEIHKKRS
jgi:hypothetical protein